MAMEVCYAWDEGSVIIWKEAIQPIISELKMLMKIQSELTWLRENCIGETWQRIFHGKFRTG